MENRVSTINAKGRKIVRQEDISSFRGRGKGGRHIIFTGGESIVCFLIKMETPGEQFTGRYLTVSSITSAPGRNSM
jgi:hypothetical protein